MNAIVIINNNLVNEIVNNFNGSERTVTYNIPATIVDVAKMM